MADQTMLDPTELQEWNEALDNVYAHQGEQGATDILASVVQHAKLMNVPVRLALNSPYQNTIPVERELSYPGDIALEEQLEGMIRYNSAAIVSYNNQHHSGIGGHIATYASACHMYEVGYNHFFKGPLPDKPGDLVLIQGHSSPGTYARAHLEGRLTEDQLYAFRREAKGGGLSSYPHPWLMPDFWQFPTVSMGLGAMTAIYQARFMKYLHHRQLADTSDRHVWCFCGDGEMDEPESMGAITRAGREKLDNLIFVVNCNLQRLDGLVYGNGQIVQELEASFKGAGWYVIKVLWGASWQALMDQDSSGQLVNKLESMCDGDFQTMISRGGAYMRDWLFDTPQLQDLVKDYSDEQLESLVLGGHDRQKIYNAYHHAVHHKGQPVLILCRTIKGFGLGDAGESKNIAHNVKKLKSEELAYIRDRFKVNVADDQVAALKPVTPPKNDPAIAYMMEKRQQLGGFVPARFCNNTPLQIPSHEQFASRLLSGTKEGRTMSTTTAFVQMISGLCKDKNMGHLVVPISPDESRTFGMEGMFRQVGIYNSEGQLYEPEDREQVMYYKVAKDGQMLQEGINEGGAQSVWLAAATSYSVHNLPMIPFYIYYSMFGFQRVGDYIWQAGDMRARGFLIGATSGRTTLNGEGLQHEDGQSHIHANLVPNCHSYDPTYAYELAVIIHHGMVEMYEKHQDVFYYITTMNENYSHRAYKPEYESGIIKGLYLLEEGIKTKKKQDLRVQLLGSGTILKEVEQAALLLQQDYAVACDVWSMTSANTLYREAKDLQRQAFRNPGKKVAQSHLAACLEERQGPVVAATDYVASYVEQLKPFVNKTFVALGTDGFGRSDTREALRSHFEVDRYHVAYSAVWALVQDGVLTQKDLLDAHRRYNIEAEKPNPLSV